MVRMKLLAEILNSDTLNSIVTYSMQYDLAIADFDTAINIAPNLPGLAYRSAMDRDAGEYDLANAYDDRGRAYLAKGESGWAIADHDAAIAIDPKFAEEEDYVRLGIPYPAGGKG